MPDDFSPEELLRYSRQLVIPEVGLQGQSKLKAASVLIVGCGALGSIIAQYLAACGVGRIGLVDYDNIELSNLQRQVLYKTSLIGKPKVQTARSLLLEINPEIRVDAYNELFNSETAERIAEPYQIIVDGTDNIPTRYLMNDLCVFTHKPFVYGAVYRFEGQVGVFEATKGACYRCVLPDPPPPELVPSCATAGVVGAVPGIIGLYQATEVIKLILGIGTPLISQIMFFDALASKTDRIRIPKNPHCKVCSKHPEVTHLIDYEKFCNMSIRDNDVLIEAKHSISAKELDEVFSKGQDLHIIDLREPVELQISSFPHAENVPFNQLPAEMEKWGKTQPIVLVCHIGFLSGIASRIMEEAGFTNVRCLKGGIRAWAKEVDAGMGLY